MALSAVGSTITRAGHSGLMAMRGQPKPWHILSRVYNWTKAGNRRVSNFTRHIGHGLQVSKLKNYVAWRRLFGS